MGEVAWHLLDNQLSRIDLSTDSLQHALHQVAALAREHLRGAGEVAVAVQHPSQAPVMALTGAAAVLDERQYASGFGPCLTATRTGDRVRIDDTAHPDVHTRFAALALGHGIHNVLAIGLTSPTSRAGFAVYGYTPARSGDNTEELLRAFAEHAAPCLTNAGALHRAVAELDHLHEAMKTRAVIEQAKGVLIALHGITPDEAFRRLVVASQDSNQKLRSVAADLVERAGTPRPTTMPGQGEVWEHRPAKSVLRDKLAALTLREPDFDQ